LPQTEQEVTMDNPFAILSQRLENIEEFMSVIQTFVQAGSPGITFKENTLNEEPLSSDDEIAEHLDCKKSTVLKYARNNVIPSYKAGRKYRFKKSEVDAALSSLTPIKRNKKGAKANG